MLRYPIVSLLFILFHACMTEGSVRMVTATITLPGLTSVSQSMIVQDGLQRMLMVSGCSSSSSSNLHWMFGMGSEY
jgi:hypothetical protein